MIAVLEEERWPELAGIFEREWHAALPTVGKADIIAEVDEMSGKIHSFIVCEQLLRIGQIHSENHYPRAIFRWIERYMPKDNSVIIITHEPRHARICEHLNMYRMNEGVVYRRDF